MSENYEVVEKLLGDFFEHHTAGDKAAMSEVLQKLQMMLYSGDVDSTPFKDYFNSMYTGRSAINFTGMMHDYPRESIIRELLQNVFGCDYEENDIKVMIEFLDEGQVKLTYNETGFTLEQVFYYLSVGRNDGNTEREGRFGLGAKSVFANVDWFKMRSNNYSLRVVNDGGTLKVRELELNGPKFNHTEIVFGLDEESQKKLHSNLVSMCAEKGDYMNMVDLCFAFIRKKHLKASDPDVTLSRTFNIAIISFGKPEVVYKIQEFRKDENDLPKIRFFENGKSVADFIHMENDGFVYLIPFAISGARREAAKVLMQKYNYFSTYELTGLVKATSQQFLQEQLSAFFVSVPNKYITNNRAGIRHDCIEEVSGEIEKDIVEIVERYKKLFVLELVQRPDNASRYMMRPRQYVFEFFYNYIHTSSLVKGLKEQFCDNISLKLPNIEEPVTFTELKQNGFFTEHSGISKEEHDDGTAMQLLYNDLDQMEAWFKGEENHVLFAKYNWHEQATDESGSEYVYAFHENDEVYLMSSDKNRQIRDYDLYDGFKNIISLKLNNCVVDGAVADENALAEAFEVIDEMFGESYRISMKYFQFVITSGGTTIQFEVSKINIGNLKKAMDVISAHEMRFENHQVYNSVVTLIMNSFTNGKDTMDFLREIKSQGGEVTLALDINKRYRFAAYGKQFMIPPNVTNADLLEVIGDVYVLIDSGMFNNRVFDFPFSAGRYSFDTDEIVAALPECGTAADVEEMLSKIYVCDLALDKIALLDANNKLLKIVDIVEPIADADKAKTAKYVVLREAAGKPQFAKFVEFLLTGKNQQVLAALYSSTEEPNVVLLDQIPYYYKPVPTIRKDEFGFLRGEVRRISGIKNPRVYKNYFARDINAKLYGYGGICQCCGHESDVINGFTLKSFSIGLLNGEKEQKFNFSLYLCANDSYNAGGWIIDDVSIGGMSPFLWLDEIAMIDYIPPEFLYCRIKYRPQVTYDICEATAESENAVAENIYDGAQETLDIILSPMMAAKWVEDNRK
ncbi:MAG: hypothetical protein IJZ95_06750 [Oscillospiraceae bacterium]|nr:hypothetical protein [Oscillospiraceae bacterium]